MHGGILVSPLLVLGEVHLTVLLGTETIPHTQDVARGHAEVVHVVDEVIKKALYTVER